MDVLFRPVIVGSGEAKLSLSHSSGTVHVMFHVAEPQTAEALRSWVTSRSVAARFTRMRAGLSHALSYHSGTCVIAARWWQLLGWLLIEKSNGAGLSGAGARLDGYMTRGSSGKSRYTVEYAAKPAGRAALLIACWLRK